MAQLVSGSSVVSQGLYNPTMFLFIDVSTHSIHVAQGQSLNFWGLHIHMEK